MFKGTTRDNFDGKKVIQLEYEAYIPMAELEMRKICASIRAKWPTVRHICIQHRLGSVTFSVAKLLYVSYLVFLERSYIRLFRLLKFHQYF